MVDSSSENRLCSTSRQSERWNLNLTGGRTARRLSPPFRRVSPGRRRRGARAPGRPSVRANRRRSRRGGTSRGIPAGFLELFAEVCRLLPVPRGLRVRRVAARAIASRRTASATPRSTCRRRSARGSGSTPRACLEAVDAGFCRGRSAPEPDCRILLDTVRHWGPEAGERVLDLHERRPLRRVVGFGMGGDEALGSRVRIRRRLRASARARAEDVGARRRVARVRTPSGRRSTRCDRTGSITASPPRPTRCCWSGSRTRTRRFCIAPTGNVRTGVVGSLAEHPLPRLLAAGVPRGTLRRRSAALFDDDVARVRGGGASVRARRRDAPGDRRAILARRVRAHRRRARSGGARSHGLAAARSTRRAAPRRTSPPALVEGLTSGGGGTCGRPRPFFTALLPRARRTTAPRRAPPRAREAATGRRRGARRSLLRTLSDDDRHFRRPNETAHLSDARATGRSRRRRACPLVTREPAAAIAPAAAAR